MARYLITGGAGFIGSHLCDELLEAGDSVTVIDDLSTGSTDNIKHHFDNKFFKFIVGNVADLTLMEELVSEADYIFHLASVVGVKTVVENPVKTIETGARGMDNVLSLAKKYNCTVLFTSTSEVYGKSSKLPFSEDDDLVFGGTNIARWSYACGKALDEFHALAYYKEYGLKIVVVRLFNTVGPRQSPNYGMVIPRFINFASKNQDIPVYGDGSHKRCFGHVKNVTWALKKLIKNSNCYGKVFNIGSSEEISVYDLAVKIKTDLNSRSNIVFIPYEQVFGPGFEETVDRAPDTRRVRNAIGFDPKISLTDIISELSKNIK